MTLNAATFTVFLSIVSVRIKSHTILSRTCRQCLRNVLCFAVWKWKGIFIGTNCCFFTFIFDKLFRFHLPKLVAYTFEPVAGISVIRKNYFCLHNIPVIVLTSITIITLFVCVTYYRLVHLFEHNRQLSLSPKKLRCSY